MNYRNSRLALTGAALFLLAGTSSFAIGIPGLGTDSKAPAAAPADATAAQDQLVKAYIAADTETLKGQALIADALGLKDQAAAANEAAAALASGATGSDSLSHANDIQKNVGEAVDASLKASGELSAESKAKVTQGLGHLGLGLVGTVKLKDAAVDFQKSAQAQISSASMIEKMSVTKKLSAGVYVAKNLPGHTTALGSGLKSAVSFAQTHKIPVPADATSALSGP